MAFIEFEGLGENLLQGVKDLNAGLKSVRDEVAKTNATIQSGAQANAEAIDETGKVIQITAQQYKRLADEAVKAGAKGSEVFAKVGQAAVQAQARANVQASKQVEQAAVRVSQAMDKAAKPVAGLRAQLTQARNELARIADETDGRITPEFIEAAKRAGELQDKVGDINATIDAFNPDRKFQAFAGVLSTVAQGAQGVVAGLGLIGIESDDTAKALLKIQQTTAFVQGLQGFLGGIGDSLKVVRATIAATTAATAAQASVTTTATAATGGLAGAFRTLTAVIAANPIGAIAVGLVALTGVIIALTNETNDAADAAKKWVDELGKADEEADRLDGLADRFRNVQRAIEDVEIEGNIDAQIKAVADRSAQDVARLQQQNRELAAEQQQALRLAQSFGLSAADAFLVLNGSVEQAQERIERFGDADQEALNALRGAYQERRALAEDNSTSILEVEGKAVIDQKKLNDQRLADEDSKNKELIAKRKRLVEEVTALEAELRRRSDQAILENADPFLRLALEEEAAQAEVAQLRRTLEEKNRELGRGAQLTIEQEQFVATIRQGIEVDFQRRREALEREQATKRIELIENVSQRETAIFEASLRERLEAQRRAGASAEQLQAFEDRLRSEFALQQRQKAISDAEALTIATIEAQQRGAETEAEFRRRIEIEKLQAQEDFAIQRLEALQGINTAEAELQRQQLQGIINGIRAQRDSLLSQPVQGPDIFDLLGLKITDQEKQQITQDLQQIAQITQQAIAQQFALQQQIVQAQVEATDALIEDQQRRRSELTALLEAELQAQQAGYANNADAIRQELDAVNQAEAEAFARRQALQAEQAKLARQQVAIDSAIQVSSLLTANANLFKAGALQGIPGTIAAIAFGLSLVATFASIRARLRAQAAENVPQFAEGGLLVGPRHSEGGVALFDRRTGQHFAEAEGGEFIVNRAATARFRPLIESLNEGDMARFQQAAIAELMHSAGVQMDGGAVRRAVNLRERYNTSVHGTTNRELLRKIDELTEEVRSFKVQEGTRPQTVTTGGKLTTTTTTRTVTKR